jgi:hypothetical protein
MAIKFKNGGFVRPVDGGFVPPIPPKRHEDKGFVPPLPPQKPSKEPPPEK